MTQFITARRWIDAGASCHITDSEIPATYEVRIKAALALDIPGNNLHVQLPPQFPADIASSLIDAMLAPYVR
ncbi:hypothetical protein DLM46_37930 [Paraburkholderia lacunae]|uniref:Uncharacterized protein n=1 Tax=Paraburkholderia lacunae TaxID=2211104 RepID=A0A370MW12_9BURK|nr:hypothetical protein DLM46_37930 [Paraburkholderia lacunae]